MHAVAVTNPEQGAVGFAFENAELEEIRRQKAGGVDVGCFGHLGGIIRGPGDCLGQSGQRAQLPFAAPLQPDEQNQDSGGRQGQHQPQDGGHQRAERRRQQGRSQ